VTGRGDLIKSGGRVVKNVTGYDLCKLLAGSCGTLAAMTEVTFKVMPAPETTSTLVIANQDRAACFRSLRMAMGSSSDVASAACLPAVAAQRSSIGSRDAPGSDLALVRVEGPEPSVQARVAALRTLLGPDGGQLREIDTAASQDLWREIRDVALLPQDDAVLWRLSAAPTAAPDLVATLEGALALEWLADWAGGLLWLAVRDADDGGAAAIRKALADSGGGHATLIRGREELRARVDVFHPEAPALARLTARVKDSFDPKRILNRGRMHPDL
jgi:glycolate oxidase FAD binding subunit